MGQALEAAALVLGSDKCRGYCLEMICADFWAGVSLETGNQDALLSALTRLVLGLPMPRREQRLMSGDAIIPHPTHSATQDCQCAAYELFVLYCWAK